MKRVALMQPYLLPYLGYFQLIAAVDTFVLYDDVQWMKGGWINRNRILVGGRADWITLPVKKEALGTQINEREFSEKFEAEKRHIVEKLRAAYVRAPFFEPTMALIEGCFASTETRADRFIAALLRTVCGYLGIETEIIRSSELSKTEGLRGQDRVVNICLTLAASQYVNAIGGVGLYRREDFAEAGVDLLFIRSEAVQYPQFGAEFVPDLSIVDLLMFNSVAQVQDFLGRFELV
jgi:hypothetical protein